MPEFYFKFPQSILSIFQRPHIKRINEKLGVVGNFTAEKRQNIYAEYFQGYGSPFFLRRCQESEHHII